MSSKTERVNRLAHDIGRQVLFILFLLNLSKHDLPR